MQIAISLVPIEVATRIAIALPAEEYHCVCSFCERSRAIMIVYALEILQEVLTRFVRIRIPSTRWRFVRLGESRHLLCDGAPLAEFRQL
jgi:hypothetical protein